jgi:AcrR family transcriptional regulator
MAHPKAMATTERTPERRYHHGQLRSALVEAAVAVLAERGVERLSLREVARRAGVSHAAPYHHFASKASMVATVAIDSFERLTTALADARASATEPVAAFRATGIAYVEFAVEHPARFALMWRPELRTADVAAVEAASNATFSQLLEAIRTAQKAGGLRTDPVEELAITAWSAVHGLAMLMLDGPLEGRTEPGELDRLTEIVTRDLFLGFGPRE